jgi:putative ABC transport system permease protein
MLLKLGWKNIIKRPFSSGLSVVLLASSIMIILLAILTMQQLQSKFNENANKIDLVVGAKGSRLQMVLCNIFHVDNPTGNIKKKDVDFLSKHPFVKSAVPISLGDSYKSYRIVGTELSFLNDIYKASLEKGKLFSKSLEIVVGADVAKQLKLKIGDSFYGSHGIEESIHDHDNFEYKVVGVLNPSGEVIDQLLLTSLESVWDVHPNDAQKGSFDLKEEKDHHLHHHHKEKLNSDGREVTAVLVNYNSPRAKFSIPGIVNKKEQLMAAEPAIEIQRLFELIQPALKVIFVLAWFVFGLAIFSIIITMLNSMKDRKYEIAMMRVGGASSRVVLISILLEGFLIAIIGGLLGLFFGHLLMEFMGNYLTSNYHYDFTGFIFSPFEIWILIGTVLIGMISALLPAISAYRIDISSTLKNNL